MNTSRNNRSKRKKAIPLYFQKSHTSLSDMLQTSSYKRRIKELLKNNKSLAVSIQDARYRAANQQREIEEHARTTVQISHAQLKLKDMASTIQKLVSDLEEVRGFLDVNSFNLLKNIDSSDHRLRIQVPDQSTIEESASKSFLEADVSAAEDLDGNTSPCAVPHGNSPVSGDECMTEIYDHHTSLARVDSVLKGCLTKPQEKKFKNQVTDNSASISIQSPSKQLEISKNKLPGKLEAFLQNYKESPRKPLQALNSIPVVKNIANTFVSKIPKVSKTQPPPHQDENSLPTELPDNAAHRRETFVVKKPCSIPEVFTSAADRRGTFTIGKLSEDNKCQGDRRGTYLVVPDSVPPIQEEPIATNTFAEPAFSAENAISNKTLLLCEDMELTEIIPTRKQWSEETEMDEEIPCDKNKETVSPLAAEDVEFTGVVPVLELPFLKPKLQDKIIEKVNVVLDKNTSPKENVAILPAMASPFDDDCFVKPFTPESTHTSSSSSPNGATFSEQKQILDSVSKSNSEDDQNDVPSRTSSTKRKKSHATIEQTDSATKQTLKGRGSSMSKRKSIAHKGMGRVSDVKPKATHRKSIAKTSFKKPVLPKDFEVDFCSDIEDELPSDISPSNSLSPCKRRTRNKSVTYETFFDDTSFQSVPEPAHKKVQIGRKVIDFFETRQSLLPTKKTFIFTNTSKKVNTESTSSAQGTDSNSPDIELAKQDKGVFEFSGSDSESSSSNIKPKKAKKRNKRSDSASSSKGKKESSNKRPRSEKLPHQHTEKLSNSEIDVQNKNDSGQKKSDSASKSEKVSLKSTSSETMDDSFVIGEKMDESSQVKELVNSKGDRIFSEFSKPIRKTISRNCKRPSAENLNNKGFLSPTENTPNLESNVGCKDVYDPSPSKLTFPPIAQDKDKGLNKHSPISESEVSGKDSGEGRSSKSSKVSEGKGKAKRVFSGVSERRSKKKSTLDPPDFLEEFKSPTILEEALPKTTWLNSNTFDLDCEMTEVYNFKNVNQAKVQENNSENKEQVPDDNQVQQSKALTENPETLQIVKAKDTFTNTVFIAPIAQALSKNKKPIKDSIKVKAAAVEQNKNDENSTKAPITDTLTSPLNNGKSKKTSTVANHEQVTEEKKMKHVESIISKVVQKALPKDVLCNKEVIALPLHGNKHEKAPKDSNQEKVSVATEKHKEDATKKLKDVLCNKDAIPIPLHGNKHEKAPKDSNQEKVTVATEKHREDTTKKVKGVVCNEDAIPVPLHSNKHGKTSKDSNQEKVTVATEKHKEDATIKLKDVLCNKDAIRVPLHGNKHEKALKDSNQEKVTVATEKHREDTTKKVKGVVCNEDAIPVPLHSNKHGKTSKDSNQEQGTVATEKHSEDTTRKFKVTQSVKSRAMLSHEDAHVLPPPSTDKNNSSTQKKVSMYNFKTTHLDDLTNNDFVPPKSKKLIHIKKDTKNKEDGVHNKEKHSKSKKPRQEKPDAEELKAGLKESASAEADQLDPKSSKDMQDFEEGFPASDPIHRQNCSGSIDSLCNVDSKGNEGRPSRRNKPTKSYAEPKLNCKMRR